MVTSGREPLDWTLSRYPAGYKFAFTIVHDADSAYSQRLAPLFDVFDALAMKLTVTVFTAWADWAAHGAIWSQWESLPDEEQRFLAPQAVPLLEESERRFYADLAARGHEIGLHSPSETSDTREEMVRSFAYFKEVFGHYPKVYVEHAKAHNKEAQANEGSNPASPYYCTDLLNAYGPWVWIDGPRGLRNQAEEKCYEIPARGATPFDELAEREFGIRKAFVRTGRWRCGNGDGFLHSYSKEHIDTLEQDGGMALVYTHFDADWLDPKTRRMRSDLAERLGYLAAKPGWFAPAGQILDRTRAIQDIRLSCQGQVLELENGSGQRIDQLAIVRPDSGPIAEAPRIVVDSIGPSETLFVDVQTGSVAERRGKEEGNG